MGSTIRPPAQLDGRAHAELVRLAGVGRALIGEVAEAIAKAGAEQAVPQRLALSKAEAAEVLGVSLDFFEEHILPELGVKRRGRRVLVPVAALHKWLEQEISENAGDRSTPPDG
jgi:excisionase family DNA binding protein